ncbi:MAG: retropepsin-like aspartic protease family protein, partial [Acetobacteraceae bacterium]
GKHGGGNLTFGMFAGTSGGRPKEKTMSPYVLIRETRKERRAPLRGCLSLAAGLGLAGALLGGTAYGPALAAGLFRFIPFLAPTSEPGHGSRAGEGFERAIWIKADANGHYYIKGSADGVPLEFMIDTGASSIVLPKAAAERLHVGPLSFDIATSTANGPVQNAQITIHKLTIGEFTVNDVPAVVNGGALDQPLLGMSWLRLFRSVQIQNGIMTLGY